MKSTQTLLKALAHEASKKQPESGIWGWDGRRKGELGGEGLNHS